MNKIRKFFKGYENIVNVDFLVELYDGVNYDVIPMIPASLGFCTPDCIYINKNMKINSSVELCYFVFLHEYAHYMRFRKNDELFNYVISDDFDYHANGIIKEEIFADRYAALMFYIANKVETNISQGLDNKTYARQYKNSLKLFFGMIKSKEDYNGFVKKLEDVRVYES